MAIITLEKQSTPATPSAGKGRLFIEGTSVKFVDDTGIVYSLVSPTTEEIQDIVGALLTAGAGITLNYNDAGNSLTITSNITQYTDEMAQDAVGLLLDNSSEITFTYNDAGDSLTAALTTTGVSAGIYGGASTYPVLTIDAAGRVTSASSQSIAANAWTELSTTTAVTNSSNSTWQNITALSLSVVAGRRYRIDYCIMFQTAAATTGLALTLQTTDTAAGAFALAMRLPQGNDGTNTLYGGTINSLGDIVVSPSVQTANANFIAALEGIFVASTSGTLVLQARSEVNGSQITIGIGSSVCAREFI